MNTFCRFLVCFGFLGSWFMMLPVAGMCSAPVLAESILNLNLRHIPDLNGKVIVQIKKGEKFSIISENENWAKIVYETNNQHITGWVSSKYIFKIQNSPDNTQMKKSDELHTTQTPENPLQFSNHGNTGAPQPPNVEAHSEKQLPIDSKPLQPADKISVYNKENSQHFLAKEQPALFRNSNENIRLISENHLESDPEKYSGYELSGFVIRVLFKISLVVISCTALFFSYSALQILKTNRIKQ